MEIEQIEEWAGQDVVDRDGEKIGKLEDVYFESGSRDAVFGCVKSGMLGRKHFLVPFADATVSRDHIRVAYSQDEVKDGPQADPGATLESGMQQELARHYGLPAGADRSYESASARAEREARAREATERAEELEKLAEEKAAQAREAELEADDTHRQAQQAHDEREQALREAAEARAQARAEQPPGA
jgi:sporulation protein YlmC with PRC-barrel domain